MGIYGGIGNALFQLSFALRISERLGRPVLLDTIGLHADYANLIRELAAQTGSDLGVCTYWERVVSCGVLTRGIPRYRELKALSRVGLVYMEVEWGKIPDTKASYFRGYFQNFELARQHGETLGLAIRNILAGKGYDVDDARQQSRCFVHVRRGDYLSAEAVKVHGVLDRAYYDRAMRQFPEFDFVFFSDDPQWVMEEFPNVQVWSGGRRNNRSVYDDLFELYSMSRFGAGIIANSTFSYWAGILGSDVKKKIVMPKRWFRSDALQAYAHRLRTSNWMVT